MDAAPTANWHMMIVAVAALALTVLVTVAGGAWYMATEAEANRERDAKIMRMEEQIEFIACTLSPKSCTDGRLLGR